MPDMEEEKRIIAEMDEEELQIHLRLRKKAEEFNKYFEEHIINSQDWIETKKRITANLKEYERKLDQKRAKKKNM